MATLFRTTMFVKLGLVLGILRVKFVNSPNLCRDNATWISNEIASLGNIFNSI